MTTPTLQAVNRHQSEDAVKWIVWGTLFFAAVFAFVLARQITNPLIGLATQQVCTNHGEELSRPATGYEQARTFTLLNRTDGACFYGPMTLVAAEDEVAADGEVVVTPPVEPGPETLTVSLSDIEDKGLYRSLTVMAAVLQLGAASIAVRLLADPLLDRFVR